MKPIWSTAALIVWSQSKHVPSDKIAGGAMLDWFSPLLVGCLCVLLILPSATLAADFTGEAMDLSDSDTITALHNKQLGRADAVERD